MSKLLYNFDSWQCYPWRQVRKMVGSNAGYHELIRSIPSKLRELTSLTDLWLCTWIGVSCWHECHACLHILAILFELSCAESRVKVLGDNNCEH